MYLNLLIYLVLQFFYILANSFKSVVASDFKSTHPHLPSRPSPGEALLQNEMLQQSLLSEMLSPQGSQGNIRYQLSQEQKQRHSTQQETKHYKRCPGQRLKESIRETLREQEYAKNIKQDVQKATQQVQRQPAKQILRDFPIPLPTLKEHQKMLEREHLNTLTSVNNFRWTPNEPNGHERVRTIHRRTIKKTEKTRELKHADAFIRAKHLGFSLNEQGKYEETEKMHRQALKGREKC